MAKPLFTTEPLDGAAVLVRLHVILDASNYMELSGAISECIESGVVKIVFDLTDVSYISSVGVVVLLEARQECLEKGGQIVVFGANLSVREVFKILDLGKVIPLVESREEALKLVG